jgi:hypothetical protein
MTLFLEKSMLILKNILSLLNQKNYSEETEKKDFQHIKIAC